MPSDRARRSFDVSRMYRSVVSQQGRVTVEADANEAEDIRAAESRAELIDIVGPTGTPDDGFKISLPGNGEFDFAIGRGTLYVGGVRVAVEDDKATYMGQVNTEWVDYPFEYPGAPREPHPTPPFTDLVYLAVTEQEISAVEDPALREPALGGPDTAGRTRLIQHVRRAPTTDTDCEAALQKVLAKTSPGLVFHQETMRLTSTAQLMVDFVTVSKTTDGCQPAARAGFMGAENQLIRVQVTSKDTPASEDRLLWGYDNASFLYRVSIQTTTTIQLQGTPVDVYHWPRENQWVEVLGTAVKLGSDASVANAVGVAGQVAGYNSTEQIITLTLATALPSGLVGQQMFLRMWEARLTFAGNGTTATEIVTAAGSSTGVVVYTKGVAVPGDYWMIGVRPSTPDAILPLRIFRQYQPPDGPSRWAAPLAMIAWNPDRRTGSVHDCRRPFDNLVQLTQECCELTLVPGEDIQALIDDRIYWNTSHGITSLHLRFAAGVFALDTPLVVAALKGGELKVSGCSATLVAAKQEMTLVLKEWDSASVFDLSVEAAVARPGYGKKPRPDTVLPAEGDEFRHIGGAITFLNCTSSSVERVAATCGSGDRRSASCVTIHNDEERPGKARVRSCVFSPGTRQIGVLLVNMDRATVEDNQIGLRAGALAPIPVDALKRLLISNLWIDGTDEIRIARSEWRAPQVRYLNGYFLHYITADEALAQAWDAAFEALREVIARIDPGIGPRRYRRDIQRLVSRILAQIFQPDRTSPLDRRTLEPFFAWLKKAMEPEMLVGATGTGIVVGGVRARDIRILNNTVADAMDGIHIGLSRRGAREIHFFVDRVQVVGNTIALRVPWYERRGHAGIFLGNVKMATVRDNRVDIELLARDVTDGDVIDVTGLEAPLVTRRAIGIRAWGYWGRMLLVTGNSSQNADIGIHVVTVVDRNAEVKKPEALFLLTQNIAIDATVPIDASNSVTIAPDNVPTP